MASSLKPYPAYKPTGVEWLGEIPEHWGVRKLRRTLQAVTERKGQDLPLLSVVREKGVVLRDVSNKNENHNFIPDDLTNYKVVQRGHFAMNKMKAWQGSYGVSKFDGIVSPAYFVFSIDGVDGDYFHTAIRSKTYVPYFTRASDGVRIGQWDLSLARMREIPFAVPPLSEQAAIVRFLNLADRRIRRYIRAKQKLIALLEEQKQVLIYRVVTRGLDPNVRLKPSGVEWLGKVPEHWEVVPLKRIAWFKSGAGFPVAEQGRQDFGIPFLKVSDMTRPGNEVWIEMTESTVSSATATRLGAFIFPAGSIIFPKVGGALLTNKRRLLRRSSCIDNNVMGCVVREANLDYAFILLQRLDLGLLAKPGPVPAIGEGEVRAIKVVLPPTQEQRELVTFVHRATANLDSVILTTNREISLLREYRTRLIGDVVTGKLDVREAAAGLPEVDPVAAEFDAPTQSTETGVVELDNTTEFPEEFAMENKATI